MATPPRTSTPGARPTPTNTEVTTIMPTLTYALLTTVERSLAEDVIRAHLNNLLADARENNDPFALETLSDEAERWISGHEVTPQRAEEIIASAHDSERDVVARYLDGGL